MLFFLMALRLAVAAFPEGGTIPAEYTCQGGDASPAMEWSGAPPQAKSFVLIVDDPDAPGGVFNHWLLFNVPASTHSLSKAAAIGESATNDFGEAGYRGPCPPKGHGVHRYYFRLYALDVPKLELKKSANRRALDRAMKGHIVAETAFMGRFERK
jgi:Raf kinase inhibitor-like YbhB/YbcL family protein